MDESFPEQCMEFTEFLFREMKIIFPIDDVLDGIFMIEDHLCLFLFLPFRLFIILDEDFCIEIGIGISLHMTRGIREVDEEILYSPSIFLIIEGCHGFNIPHGHVEFLLMMSEKT